MNIDNADDRIIFEVTKDKLVVIKKAMLIDVAYLRAVEFTLTEWNSENDEQYYRDL